MGNYTFSSIWPKTMVARLHGRIQASHLVLYRPDHTRYTLKHVYIERIIAILPYACRRNLTTTDDGVTLTVKSWGCSKNED